MVKAHQRVLLIVIAIFLLSTPTLAAPPMPPTKSGTGTYTGPDYRPGQVLVKFKTGHAAGHGSITLAGDQFTVLRANKALGFTTLQVPPGQEQATLTRLKSQPDVEYASLNWILRTDAQPLKPPSSDLELFQEGLAPALQPATLLTKVSNLHMTTVQGRIRPENKFPSGTGMVDAVFDYNVSPEGEPLRVSLMYDPALRQTTVLTITNVYTGNSGRNPATVPLMVGAAFPGRGEFPVGSYQTTVSDTPDQGQTWRPITSTQWSVVTTPNDLYYGPYQWNLNNTGQNGATPDADIDAPEAWDYTTGSSNVVVAIVDTGIDLNHPDLKSKLWRNPGEIAGNRRDDDGNGYIDDIYGYDFSENGSPDVQDLNLGTGTMAAGIIAAASNNRDGIAGVAWGARLMAVKVLSVSDDGAFVTTVESVVQGITYAANQGAKVIYVGFNAPSLSLDKLEILQDAVNYAHDRGALVITPGGDCWWDGSQYACPDSDVYPAAFSSVLAVSGTDKSDRITAFSYPGPHIAVAAPSVNLITTWWTPGYRDSTWLEILSGSARTSWAAAHVAGVASLVWSMNPKLAPDQVKAIIEQSADKVHADEIGYEGGRNNYYGYGRVNAYKAVLSTPHYLTLDQSEVRFLTDTPSRLCYQVHNTGSSAYSWQAVRNDGARWLTLSGPYNNTASNTPSTLEVCADPSQIEDQGGNGPRFGTYTDAITITSTLPVHVNNPFKLSVTLIYTSAVQRAFLPLAIIRP